ncbi:MAG: tetratricopeptide repeat protein [Candidatus Omnitrophota bacterium]|nr:MAG: tetratricopeptide repeat protein [Candidatus Omnitrophota bacterium]
MKSVYKKYVPLIVIVLVGFGVYANSLRGQFILDDTPLIKNNISIRSSSPILHIFTKNIGEALGKQFNFWRPLQVLTYRLDYSLWRLNTTGFHLTNTVLHIAVALCIFWFITLLFADKFLSFITSIFFVIHPIHTEAVSYIAGRADSLAALFLLLCFIFYIKHLSSNRIHIYIIMFLSYVCALLSRENSLILPVILLLYHYTFSASEGKKRIKLFGFLTLSLVALGYVVLRLTLLRSLLPHTSVASTVFERTPGFFVAFAHYLRLLILPLSLHMEYGKEVFAITDIRAIIGILIFLALFIYAFKIKNINKLIFFSISWFIIMLLPQSNLYPINAYMAEHWLYLPSIGFFLIVAKLSSLSYRTKSGRFPAIIIIITIVCFYGVLTIRQNAYWIDSIRFYERTLEQEPQSLRVLNNLGLDYRNRGQYEESVSLYERALAINPDYAIAHNNLGLVYYDMGRYQDALESYKKAIKIDPNNEEAYNNVGLLYYKLKQYQDALTFYNNALEINPKYARAYHNIGLIHYDRGEIEEAISLYEKAIELNPNHIDSYNNLGLAYYSLGRYKKAETFYKNALKINPRHAQTYNNLGLLYRATARIDEAFVAHNKAIEINPNFAESYNNLGVLYGEKGQNEKALTFFNKTIEINPNYAEAYNNLGRAYKNSGKLKEAAVAYKKAIEIKPDYALAYNKLGLVYQDIGQPQDAIASFKKAIELRPDVAESYNNLGALYGNLGRDKEAFKFFKKAIEVNPNYGEGHSNLAISYFYQKRYKLAIQHCDKAAELDYKVNPQLLEMLKPYRKK